MSSLAGQAGFNGRQIPPASHELRPERVQPRLSKLDQIVHGLASFVVPPIKSRLLRQQVFCRQVHLHGESCTGLTRAQLKTLAQQVGLEMRNHGFREDLAARSFAIIREVAGLTLGLRHYDVQLFGGFVMLNNMVAEMDTGEGKTLTATLTAATAALAGIPVHVISVNDYLTARDAEEMRPVYEALGLSVGCVTQDLEQADRRLAYLSDITYTTNNDVCFDYLRDKLSLRDRSHPTRIYADYLLGQGGRGRDLILRGLHFAIVDEADSVFVDEARTPLVISGGDGNTEQVTFYEEALALAGRLKLEDDFELDLAKRQVKFTEKGRISVKELTADKGVAWQGRLRREEVVSRALTALHLFHLDEHYVVSEGKVQIVDEFTGRIMADRTWEQGLHQLIEVKEGCEMSDQRQTLSRISYQRFFRKYRMLAGMTGTAREIRRELWTTYGLTTVKIPPNRPKKRQQQPDCLVVDGDAKFAEIARQVEKVHGENRPVLVGTRSVIGSEKAGQALQELGLHFQILNAKQNDEEAAIIARAGEPGCITIATNMAGRGTDIKLGVGVEKIGGLHVILSERHEAARIDRQLIGRCGRQGDRGSFQAIVALDDVLLASCSGFTKKIIALCYSVSPQIGQAMGLYVYNRAQKKQEKYHARIRRELMKQDTQQGDLLSFSGKIE
jgi:preprotein translocase subunit SecA